MDPAALHDGSTMLLDKGLLGLAVLALSAVVVYLYRDNSALRREITLLARETATGLANSSATIAGVTTEVSELTRKTERVVDGVMVLPPAIEGLAKQLEANAGRMDRLIDMAARGTSR